MRRLVDNNQSFTKFVLQSIQFLSDKRARDAMIEQESTMEEEDIEVS